MRQEVNRILRELAEQRLGALGQCRVCAAGDFSEQFAGAFFVTDFTTGNRKIKLGLESGEVRALFRNTGTLQSRHRYRRR